MLQSGRWTSNLLADRTHAWFETQVQRHRHRIYGYAAHYLNDKDDAADVTQEVLLRLWTYRKTVDEERLLGWLLRVTRNACVDVLRKRKARQNRLLDDAERLEQVASPGQTPEGTLEASDFRRHLMAALDRLEEPHRSIVILRELQDMKYEEISEALELPLNTVKVYLHRGRKALREQLSSLLQPETI